jgi:putative methionine-R-sulfoxide reductase with GAF domain
VVPVFDTAAQVRAVLDVDFELPGAFDATDATFLEEICRRLTLLA